MNKWQSDMWHIVECATCEKSIFEQITIAAKRLGFEYCAYGLQLPLPLSAPNVVMLDNYPDAWKARYASAQYLKVDPTVLYGRHTQKPLTWTEALFSKTPELWEEAQSFGIHVGWSQSHLDTLGVGGMLSVSRSSEALTSAELTLHEKELMWLVCVAHVLLSRALNNRHKERYAADLTEREREVLKWTADGKSASEISDILIVSKNTIDFHIKNAILKLKTSNKTAAVVRAVMLGLLF
ncbi:MULTISPECIES: autoinducer binding domain-containing protein [unclassified Pseudomonas]|uniref:autoinducer binding domain-containing protein n=1 Tax=unclassified Pseudomonas TaxID=196821 RepID=UPI002AC9BF91|nr:MULTISPECIES: autoinducer binding domain-containing protein [unclassified Pseudomonas]MEB0048169.1 autoinducer binding domain-containing protein [Pseudomonas sp. Dout3]MEB0098303.1 autoinducer binding domain-containing protein [Pseudomonas sp. DC1.2]WPX57091.1 autoinducer binding domain-containing protein [Pseudomonas sp. DC1.2]